MFLRVLLFSSLSLTIMTIVDFMIGAQAEFINAWSVIERLTGQPSSAGNSFVYNKTGGIGELFIVVLINSFIGLLLALLSKRIINAKSNDL